MFDGPNFERSRSYFSALQLLRIFSDHIKETRKDLRTNLVHLERKGLKFGNFQETLRILREFEEMLLERIDRKTEEIKTLRDGVGRLTISLSIKPMLTCFDDSCSIPHRYERQRELLR
jgi:hypothetical protein